MTVHNSFADWLQSIDGKPVRYLTYRRMFTPYEENQKYIDESEFVSCTYDIAYIEEAIDLGNGDWYLGFREIIDDECDEKSCILEWRKLSEIQMCQCDNDGKHDEDPDDFVWEMKVYDDEELEDMG